MDENPEQKKTPTTGQTTERRSQILQATAAYMALFAMFFLALFLMAIWAIAEEVDPAADTSALESTQLSAQAPGAPDDRRSRGARGPKGKRATAPESESEKASARVGGASENTGKEVSKRERRRRTPRSEQPAQEEESKAAEDIPAPPAPAMSPEPPDTEEADVDTEVEPEMLPPTSEAPLPATEVESAVEVEPAAQPAEAPVEDAEAPPATLGAEWRAALQAGNSVRAEELRALFTPADAAALAPLILDSDKTLATGAYAAMERLAFQTAANGEPIAQALLDLVGVRGAVGESASPEWTVPVVRPGLFGLLEVARGAAAWTAARRAEQGLGSIPTQTRLNLLELVGLTAGPGQTSALAGLLEDREVAGAACRALARVPGPEATAALAAHFHVSHEATRAEIAAALGARGAVDAKEALIAFVKPGTPGDRWAGLAALARLGVPPEAAAPRSPQFTPQENARYAQCTLTAAQVLAERGEAAAAEKLFVEFANSYAVHHQIRAVLAGLTHIKSKEAIRLALGYLGAPEVRPAAMAALVQAQDPGAEAALVKAFETGDPALQASVLQVLAQRNAEALPELLNEAVASQAVEVRFVAARLMGGSPDEADVAALVIEGNSWIRTEALRAYLDLAHTRAIAGEAEAAAAQFQAVVDGPFSVAERREALEGLGNLGRPQDRALVEEYVPDPELGKAAYAALVRITMAGGDPDSAKAELHHLAMNAQSAEVAAVAVEALASLGAGAEDFGQQQGAVLEWRVLGPFPMEASTALDPQVLADATAAGKPVPFQGVTFEWQTARASGLPAALDLASVLGPYTEVIAYAAGRVSAPTWTPVQVRVEAGGPFVLWLNGKEVLSHTGESETSVNTTLKSGVNRLVLQTTQRGSAWRCGVRIFDREGRPLDLSQQRLPEDGTAGLGLGAGATDATAAPALP